MPEIATLFASGTGNGKVIAGGVQRNARYAIFPRCFIHYKIIFEDYLKKWGFSAERKQLCLDEIFGEQEKHSKVS